MSGIELADWEFQVSTFHATPTFNQNGLAMRVSENEIKKHLAENQHSEAQFLAFSILIDETGDVNSDDRTQTIGNGRKQGTANCWFT